MDFIFETPLKKEYRDFVKKCAQMMQSNQVYSKFKIVYSDSDMLGSCSFAMTNPVNNAIVDKYFFIPDGKGNLRNISIYGSSVNANYKAISDSRICFGFKVSEVTLETKDTIEPFVDVYIEYGQPIPKI